jgi:hypothetical protein
VSALSCLRGALVFVATMSLISCSCDSGVRESPIVAPVLSYSKTFAVSDRALDSQSIATDRKLSVMQRAWLRGAIARAGKERPLLRYALIGDTGGVRDLVVFENSMRGFGHVYGTTEDLFFDRYANEEVCLGRCFGERL